MFVLLHGAHNNNRRNVTSVQKVLRIFSGVAKSRDMLSENESCDS